METTMNKKVIEANLTRYNKKFSADKEAYLAENELTKEQKKFYNLKDNDEFFKALIACNTAEDVQKAFAGVEIEIDLNEAQEYFDDLQSTSNAIFTATEELSDDELESVTGGSFWDGLATFAKHFITGFAIGIIGGLAIAALAATAAGPAGFAIGMILGVAGGIFLGIVSGASAAATGQGGWWPWDK